MFKSKAKDMKEIHHVFIIEKLILIGFLKVICIQNQLPIVYGSTLFYNIIHNKIIICIFLDLNLNKYLYIFY